MRRMADLKANGRGFTLIEMLTVLAIIILLSALSVVATSPLLSRNRERYAARQVHAAILQARHYAIATNSSASLIVYQSDGFCVVTNAQYEPISPPVVLPAGCGLSTSPTHTVNNADWSARVGDRDQNGRGPAYDAGYAAGRRPMMVVTFRHDGTVRFVTSNSATATAQSGGAIVIGIGGGTLGALKDACDFDDTEIELTGRGKFESSGIAILDNELIRYSIKYSPTGNKVYLTNMMRGIFTPARNHSAGVSAFAPNEALIIFPLTGGVVQMRS